MRLRDKRLVREFWAVLGLGVLVACHLGVAFVVSDGDEQPALMTAGSAMGTMRMPEVATVDGSAPVDLDLGKLAAGVLEEDDAATVEFEPAPTFEAAPAFEASVGGEPLVVPTVAALSDAAPDVATPSPAPAGALLPTIGPGDVRLLGLPSAAQATPTPVFHQVRIPGTDVNLRRQTLFMSQVSRVPAGWPSTENVFYERTARHIGWMVDLDYASEEPEFEMRGLMRWLNVTGGSEHVIYQEEYVMDADSAGNALFFMLGKDLPGFWYAGDYRLELWDNRDRLAVYQEFKVK